jgi:hypothetical protein
MAVVPLLSAGEGCVDLTEVPPMAPQICIFSIPHGVPFGNGLGQVSGSDRAFAGGDGVSLMFPPTDGCRLARFPNFTFLLVEHQCRAVYDG